MEEKSSELQTDSHDIPSNNEGLINDISEDNNSVGDGDGKTQFTDFVASYQTIQEFISPSFNMTDIDTTINTLLDYILNVLIVAKTEVVAHVQYHSDNQPLHLQYFEISEMINKYLIQAFVAILYKCTKDYERKFYLRQAKFIFINLGIDTKYANDYVNRKLLLTQTIVFPFSSTMDNSDGIIPLEPTMEPCIPPKRLHFPSESTQNDVSRDVSLNKSPYGIQIDDSGSLHNFLNPSFPHAQPNTPAAYANSINFSHIKHSFSRKNSSLPAPTGSVLTSGINFQVPHAQQNTPSASAKAQIPFVHHSQRQSTVFTTPLSFSKNDNVDESTTMPHTSISPISKNNLSFQYHVNLMKNKPQKSSSNDLKGDLKDDFRAVYESKLRYLKIQMKQQQAQLQAAFDKQLSQQQEAHEKALNELKNTLMISSAKSAASVTEQKSDIELKTDIDVVSGEK